jgi:hypothetical protein
MIFLQAVDYGRYLCSNNWTYKFMLGTIYLQGG